MKVFGPRNKWQVILKGFAPILSILLIPVKIVLILPFHLMELNDRLDNSVVKARVSPTYYKIISEGDVL